MALDIFITFILVFLNGFFVAAEFAIVKVRASQLELKAKAGNKFAIRAKDIVSHLDGYLAATQLGITIASLGLGWIGEPVVSKILIGILHMMGIALDPETAHHIALPLAFAIITILHIVFGELAPKSIAIQLSEKTTMAVSYPLHFFYIIFRPFIWVLNGIARFFLRILGIDTAQGAELHSSDELKYIIRQGKESGTIEEIDYDIIRNAFDFSEHTVRQVMIPRTQVLAIDLNQFNDEVLDRMIEANYSRVPCYEDDIDRITGIVYLKDILLKLRTTGTVLIRDILRPVLIVPDTKKIGHLLKDFQVRHQQLAVVVNEYGGMKGIITMEDILEELVGQIQDEYDTESPLVEKTGEHTYTAVASAPIDDLNRLLPHPLKRDEQYETLAGYLILRFKHIPALREKISSDKYEFTVVEKNRNSIALVQIRDLSPGIAK